MEDKNTYSAEELYKSQLLNTFKKSGILDSLKVKIIIKRFFFINLKK